MDEVTRSHGDAEDKSRRSCFQMRLRLIEMLGAHSKPSFNHHSSPLTVSEPSTIIKQLHVQRPREDVVNP